MYDIKIKCTQYPNNCNKNVLASVCIQTYQQIKYIQDCINGVLAQKTNFNFEILIGEDDSNDGTKEKCIQYAKKFPEKIRLFLHKRENAIYVEGRATGRFNFINNLNCARGKYVALCEGDDYWTDPYKLQKQVDFLEANPTYGMVCTDYDVLKSENITKSILLKTRKLNKAIDIDFEKYILKPYLIRTLTVCFRTILFHQYLEDIDKEIVFTSPAGDVPLWCFIGVKSKIKYLPFSSSVYRHTANTASRQNGIDKQYNFSKGVIAIRKYLISKYPISYKARRKVQKSEIISELFFAFRKKDRIMVLKYFINSVIHLHISKRAIYFFVGSFNDRLYNIVSKKYELN